MTFIKINLLITFFLCFLSLSAFSQQSSLASQKVIWRTRIATVTDNLLKETSKINELEKALLLAQLGDLWWQSDPNQANVWFEKSVSTIFFYSSEDIKSNSQIYLQTVRQILRILSSRNPQQTNRLISILSDFKHIVEENKDFSADTIVDFALTIIKDNPNKATELGILSFKFGQPSKFYELYWELKKINPNLAGKLFRTAILSALSSPNAEIASTLKTAVFPETIFPNAPQSILSSKSVKIETLNFLADYVLQQQTKFTNKSIEDCSVEASLIAPLRNQFTILLPQRESVVAQAISTCLSAQSEANRNLSTSGADTSVKSSVEELLKLADEAKDDVKVRTYYLLRAASFADEQKKYKIAAEILENMTEEERKIDLEFWEELRYTVASGLAYQQFQEQDLQGAFNTLEKVPTDNRAFAKVGFALKFSPNDLSAREFCLARVEEADRDFVKSDKPFSKKSGFWFQIIKIHSNYNRTTEAAGTFEKIVKDFNKEFSNNKETKPFISSEVISKVVSTKLIETQDNSLFQTTNLITDEKSRVQINLAFLKIAVKQLETLNKEIEKEAKQKVS